MTAEPELKDIGESEEEEEEDFNEMDDPDCAFPEIRCPCGLVAYEREDAPTYFMIVCDGCCRGFIHPTVMTRLCGFCFMMDSSEPTLFVEQNLCPGCSAAKVQPCPKQPDAFHYCE
jgi:hypothetical protein